MRSVGMLISRAFCIARRSRKLPSGLPPPSLAAIVISRLARVKACPRLWSTMAFLCLMPAHFEWPDKLEVTSEHAFGDFSSLQEHMPTPRRDDISGFGGSCGLDFLAIDADSALLGQSPRITPTGGDARGDEHADDVSWSLDLVLLFLIRDLFANELAHEMGFGSGGRLLPIQPLDQQACQRCLGVARLQREHGLELLAFDA